MDWIRKILETAKVNEDGTVDIDALMTSINAEFPKQAIPKTEYNNVKGQLKTANDTITDLKKSNSDNAELQTKLKEYNDTIKTMESNHKAELLGIKKQGAIDSLLLTNKAKHSDLLAGKFDLEKIIVNEDGTISGLNEQFNSIKETYKDLFETIETPEPGKVDNNPTYKYTPQGGNSGGEDLAAQALNAVLGI